MDPEGNEFAITPEPKGIVITPKKEGLEDETSLMDQSKTIEKSLEQILTKEQLSLIATEAKIGKVTLGDDGKINITGATEEASEDIAQWQLKNGVLDARKFIGINIVVFNSRVIVPEGCPVDLKEEGRSGEYDAFSNTTFTDLSNTWDHLYDKWQPSWAQQNLRHEVRHGLVSSLDQARYTQNNTNLRRVVDQDHLNATNPELARQLGYLDEIHSQYFDVIEGEIEGHSSFRTLDSQFYSIEGNGTHPEVASSTPEGQEVVKSLFYHIQGFILLKRMSEQILGDRPDIINLISGVGVVLATERSLQEANNKIRSLWQNAQSIQNIGNKFNEFLNSYQPSASGNTPVVTPELRDILVQKEIPLN